MPDYAKLDAWIDAHFDEEVRFLQEMVRVPTDTPPGNNAPHAERTAELIAAFGFEAEKHPVPAQAVKDYGLESITNLIVRRRYGEGGRTLALNAHGDVVPPGEGWTHDPYGAQIEDGQLYGRAAAVSKSDFASFTFAVRALEAVAKPAHGSVELTGRAHAGRLDQLCAHGQPRAPRHRRLARLRRRAPHDAHLGPRMPRGGGAA